MDFLHLRIFIRKFVCRCVAQYPSPGPVFRRYLSLATFVLQFCIPLTITGVCYGKIARKLWFSHNFFNLRCASHSWCCVIRTLIPKLAHSLTHWSTIQFKETSFSFFIFSSLLLSPFSPVQLYFKNRTKTINTISNLFLSVCSAGHKSVKKNNFFSKQTIFFQKQTIFFKTNNFFSKQFIFKKRTIFSKKTRNVRNSGHKDDPNVLYYTIMFEKLETSRGLFLHLEWIARYQQINVQIFGKFPLKGKITNFRQKHPLSGVKHGVQVRASMGIRFGWIIAANYRLISQQFSNCRSTGVKARGTACIESSRDDDMGSLCHKLNSDLCAKVGYFFGNFLSGECFSFSHTDTRLLKNDAFYAFFDERLLKECFKQAVILFVLQACSK